MECPVRAPSANAMQKTRVFCQTLLTAFDEVVAPTFSQIHNLHQQNLKLRTARDLLLPRLMSGEIAV